MPARRTPKVEALVVNAIRRLQDVEGSTPREISNYISQEYNVPSEEIGRQVQFALRRGLSYGILKRSKGGYYSCDYDYLRQLSLGNGMGDGVMEPCPAQPWRFGVRKRKREKARRRRYQRERRERERRERERKERERRKRSRTRRRRGRRRRRRPRRSRARTRRGRRTSRRRRRRRTPSRRRRRSRRGVRSRSGARARTRVNPSEMEMEAPSPKSPRNDIDRKEDSHKSESSVHSIERDSQNSSRNSETLNTSDV